MDSDGVLTVEYKYEKPIELADLTRSLSALAEAFKEYATEHTHDPLPDNMRLYVKELQSGSIIAQLQALTEQAHWILDHIDVLAGFLANTQDVLNYFLGKGGDSKEAPTRHQAQNLASIVEPIAKDNAAQLNMTINGPVSIHYNTIHINSLEANAVQNGVARYLGPTIPHSAVYQDQLLILDQVKNRPKAKTGDFGIIEALSPRAVKLQFMSEEAKRRVLELEGENPFQCVFLVDVEVRTSEGKPVLYRVIEVKDAIPKPH